MSKDSAKKHTHTERKAPSKYSEDKTLNEVDKKLVEDLELSEIEFARYKKLPPYKKAEIIHLLTERKRLNHYVNNHLKEEINKQFGPLMQFFLPSDNDLRYALQKVDEIENAINEQVGEGLQLFDRDVTRRNRLETLLITAHTYQDMLDKKLAKGHASHKSKQFESFQKKRDDLALLIEELHVQRDSFEFFIHNKAVLNIKDSELGYFISKLKSIGIEGLTPKANKYQPTFFNISIITTIFEHLNPNTSIKNKKESESDTKDVENVQATQRSKRPKPQ